MLRNSCSQRQQGSVQFVLRNGADQNKPEQKPVLASQLMADVAPPQPKAACGWPPLLQRLPDPPEFYTVETIEGEKHTVDEVLVEDRMRLL